jgi:hypothetical protein
MWRRLGTELRDLTECVLLPGLAALLPWRVGFRLLRVFSRFGWLYRERCEAALRHAVSLGQVGAADAAAWVRAARLVILVDHADFMLAITRGDGWMRRHLRVTGRWPDGGAAILCTFHWGAGMWGLRHAGASGLKPHALVAPLERAAFPHNTVLYHYYRLRNRAVQRALGSAPIDATKGLRRVVSALRTDEQVMAAVDVPADQVSASEIIPFMGYSARVPRALFKLAVERQMPLTVYVTGFDPGTGMRSLQIEEVLPQESVERMAAAVFTHLEQAIRTQPPAWHFWAVADRFFVQAST